MSLNWDITKVENSSELCYIVPPVEWNVPPAMLYEDGTMLNPKTKALIFLTMHTGIAVITEENAAEFYARSNVIERLLGETNPITFEDVKAHIGLRTNAFQKGGKDETRAAWYKRWMTMELDDVIRRNCP